MLPPATSSRRNAATSGVAEQRADGGEAAGGAGDGQGLLGGVTLQEPHGQDPEAAAEEDERGFRSGHSAEAERRQGGENDSRQLDRTRAARHLQTFGGLVPGGPGQVANRQRDDQARENE